MKSKQLKMGVILSYVSTGLNMVIQLLYTPIILRLLGQSEYGLYTLISSVVSYLSLFSLGFTGSYVRFYSKYQNQNDNDNDGVARLNGLFLKVYLFMASIAVLCGLVLAQFPGQVLGSRLTSNELSKSTIMMIVLVFNIGISFPNVLFDSIISTHEQFLFQRGTKLLSTIFNPLIGFPLLLLGFGSIGLVVTTTIITVFQFLLNIYYCFSKLQVRFIFGKIDVELLREIFNFSIFLFIGMIVNQVNWSLDKYILGRVSGTNSVAVYGVGAQINTLFITVSSVVHSVFIPRINRIAAEKKSTMNQQFIELMIKVGRIQFLILSAVMSGFIIFGKYFMTEIYASPLYKDSYIVALLLVIPSMIELIQNLALEIQRALNKHRALILFNLGMSAFNLIISIPLAKNYGPIGAAFGTAISLVICNGFAANIYYYAVLKLDIMRFWKSIMHMFRALILPILFGFFIMNYVEYSGTASFAGWIILYLIVYIISIWLFGMNKYEKKLFGDIIIYKYKKNSK